MIQNLVNIMAAGALMTQGAKTSAVTVLTVSDKHVVFQREEFQLPVPSQF